MNIENSTINTILNGGDDNDVILNWAGGTTIVGGAGNDSIQNSTIYLVDNQYGHVTIDAGDGNDTVNNYDPRVSINAGAGNDSINIWEWDEVTVRGGTGDDTLVSSGNGNLIEYADGDGNDVIIGYAGEDIIRLSDGTTYSTMKSGSDVIVSVGSGSITLKDVSNNEEINILNGTVESVSLTNQTLNALMLGSVYADTLINYGNGVTIRAGAGSDYIFSSTANTVENGYGFVTIDGGSGDDTVISNDPNVSINGGSGDDFIYTPNDYSNITIKAGKGNDTLLGDDSLGGSRIYLFESDDGDDVFANFSSDDLIAITDGSTYTAMAYGDDVILKIGNGSIRLVNGGSSSINLLGGVSVNSGAENVISIDDDTATLNNSRSDVSIVGSNVDDSIVNSGQNVSIAESNGFNTIVNLGSRVTIGGGDYDDMIINNGAGVSIGGGNGDDTLSTSADSTLTGDFGHDLFRVALADSSSSVAVNITDFSSDDTLALLSTNTTGFVGSLVGGVMRLTDNGGALNLTLDGVNSFGSISGAAVELRNYDGTLRSTTTLAKITTVRNLDSIEGVNLNRSGKTLKIKTPFTGTINASDYGDKVKTINAATDVNAVELIGNDLNNIIKGSKGGSTLDGGLGNDKLYGGKGSDTFIYTAGKDVVYKYESEDRIILGTSIDSIKISGKNIKFMVNKKESLTVKKAVGKEMTIVDADGVESKYVFTKQNSDFDSARVSSNTQLISDEYFEDDEFTNFDVGGILFGTSKDDTLKNYAGGAIVFGSYGNDSIFSSTLEEFLIARQHFGYVTIEGGAGDDTIESHDPYVSINGGEGNDLIKTNGWDNVTIEGGAGDDTVIGSVNKAEVYRFGAGDGSALIIGFDDSDTLEFLDGAKYSTLKSGDNLIVKMLDDNVKLNGSGKTLKIKTPFEGTINASDYGNKVKTINAASDKNAVAIIGNELNNVLKASKGGSTIEGGAGNDKITCGAGSDLIVYSDGDGVDVIKKFDATQDKIQIENSAIDSVKIKGKHVVLNVGDGSLTVQKAVGQELTIIDADGVESKYVFTKQNSDLNSARVSSNAQLPSEDYWFEQDSAEDQLSEIMSADAAIDLHFDPLREVLEPSSMLQSITQSNEGAQRRCKNHG